jgi:hypothetical protein
MPTITLVHAPACHFCADAETELADVAMEFDLRVDLVAADSEPGRALVDEHRPTMFPLVLMDGTFFSQGRLPRRKLRTLLAARTGAGVP